MGEPEVKKAKTEAFDGNKLVNYKCFENFDAFDIGGVGKSITMTQYHIFQEDNDKEPLVANFDQELIIPDLDTAILVAKENVFRRRMEKFIEVLKTLPDDYLKASEETLKSLDEDWTKFKET